MTSEEEHGHTLEVVATALNEPEADLIRQRLADAGIPATSQRTIGGPEWGRSGGQYVYVEAEHLARAQEILAAPSDISEEELAALAEAAAPSRQAESSDGRDEPGAR